MGSNGNQRPNATFSVEWLFQILRWLKTLFKLSLKCLLVISTTQSYLRATFSPNVPTTPETSGALQFMHTVETFPWIQETFIFLYQGWANPHAGKAVDYVGSCIVGHSHLPMELHYWKYKLLPRSMTTENHPAQQKIILCAHWMSNKFYQLIMLEDNN